MANSALADWLLAWAQRRRGRVAGYNPWKLGVRLVRSAARDRVPGLAAEMAFFGLLALVPLLIAVGASLGYLERILGVEQVADLEGAVIGTLAVVLGPELTFDTLAPLVRGLLEQQRGGLALTSLLAVVGTTLHALDVAYGVTQRRSAVVLRSLGRYTPCSASSSRSPSRWPSPARCWEKARRWLDASARAKRSRWHGNSAAGPCWSPRPWASSCSSTASAPMSTIGCVTVCPAPCLPCC